MGYGREQQRFPTRQTRYPSAPGFAVADVIALKPNTLYRMVAGLDQGPRPMTPDEAQRLDDPFGRLLRSGRPFPLTARRLLAEIDVLPGPQSLPNQLVFLVADGGHVPWTPETNDLQRSFRFAIARGATDFTLLISCSTRLDASDDGAFLQVLGWDATHEVFHFYERRHGTFAWAGMSEHALDDATRGRGPFDSHVNGSVVMKEMRSPWAHWHAPQAGINEEAFAPDDALRDEPIFRSRVTAERLETEIVRPWIRRWNEARVRKAVTPAGTWPRVRHFLRQAVTDTTVNLASSETGSASLTDASVVRPPLSFFLNRDVLFDTLGLEPDDTIDIAIPGKLYRECLRRYDVHRTDGRIRLDADAPFAFLTPEPAFEDTQLVAALVDAKLMSARFVTALTMIDFQNPVFSHRRKSLLRYVPETLSGGELGAALEQAFVAGVTTAVAVGQNGAADADSPEREFLSVWSAPDPAAASAERIARYLRTVAVSAANAAVVDGWFRLMEHRRRRFRKRPLAEFALTVPRTNIPAAAPPLRMTEAGVVETDGATPANDPNFLAANTRLADPLPRSSPMQRFDPPGFLDDMTDAEKDQWSRTVSGWIDRAAAGRPHENDGPRRQFFNPLGTPPDADAEVAVVSWNAFPRQVKSTSLSDRHRWRRADADRGLQDEYCEWSVTRDPATDRIVRVTFTCEGPEYWETLAALNPAKVLELYQKYVSPDVRRDDLFAGGKYNPKNPYNNSTTNGAMHLIQGANTLTAEIELAAAATIRRVRGGKELTGAQELIDCSRYGESGRNSDPFIGEQVNALARKKADITLNNPVGLYLHQFNPVGWVTPDGKDAREFWAVVRGRDGHAVRAVFEVPAGLGYAVGDIKIAGKAIEFGAQIADFITIKLEGLATRLGKSTAEPFNGCRGSAQGAAAAGAGGLAAAVGGGVAAPEFPLRPRLTLDASTADPDPAGEAALLARLPDALRRENKTAAAEGITAVAADHRAYPRLPAAHFKPRLVSGRIMAYASPDSTYAITKRLLDSARDSIVIGIYDFDADYIKEILKRAMRRGVTLSLMLDTDTRDDPTIFTELQELGATCVRAPSSSAGAPITYFGNAHEKIIVVDRQIVMIQSGNWSENSIPFNEGDGVVIGEFVPGNRDMGIAVESPELAMLFADLVTRDMRLALGEPADKAAAATADTLTSAVSSSEAAAIFFEKAPADVPRRLFPSLTVTPTGPVRITPAVTPENFHTTAKPFLRAADRSLRIQQQYIRGTQSAVRELLTQIREARGEHPELDVRIIVSPKFMTTAQRQELNQAMNDFGLAFDENYRFLSPRHFVHCHNKLIVADEEAVLLGSQNWSTTGVLTNREASLLVEHAGIAAYFAQIFDADWVASDPGGAPAGAAFKAAVRGIVRPDEFARGNTVISSVRDYTEI